MQCMLKKLHMYKFNDKRGSGTGDLQPPTQSEIGLKYKCCVSCKTLNMTPVKGWTAWKTLELKKIRINKIAIQLNLTV